jgi:hypothetical protein
LGYYSDSSCQDEIAFTCDVYSDPDGDFSNDPDPGVNSCGPTQYTTDTVPYFVKIKDAAFPELEVSEVFEVVPPIVANAICSSSSQKTR